MTQPQLCRFLIVSFLTAMMFSTSCSIQVDQRVQEGRTALLTGRPNDAIDTFKQAAESSPNYQTPYALRESVWTYLGRAYYETANYPEARTALDKALALDETDSMARLYRGMTLTRTNDRDRGLADMENSLKQIYTWLDELPNDYSTGNFWDPSKQIRKLIETGLAGKPSAIELVVTAQRVGKLLEEEIDRSRRDRGRAVTRY